MTESTKKIIACAAVLEEMLPILPPEIGYEILDFGLHFRPENLKNTLQEAIDKSANDAEILILGYGLCSNGAVGLKAPETVTLVIPKVHDCIAIFLGSHAAYMEQMKKEKGTFFLAKGGHLIYCQSHCKHWYLVSTIKMLLSQPFDFIVV